MKLLTLRVSLGFLVVREGAEEICCDGMKSCAVGFNGWDSLKHEDSMGEDKEELLGTDGDEEQVSMGVMVGVAVIAREETELVEAGGLVVVVGPNIVLVGDTSLVTAWCPTVVTAMSPVEMIVAVTAVFKAVDALEVEGETDVVVLDVLVIGRRLLL